MNDHTPTRDDFEALRQQVRRLSGEVSSRRDRRGRALVAAAVLVCAAVPAVAYSLDPVPHPPVSGEPIVAEEVAANYAHIVDAVSALESDRIYARVRLQTVAAELPVSETEEALGFGEVLSETPPDTTTLSNLQAGVPVFSAPAPGVYLIVASLDGDYAETQSAEESLELRVRVNGATVRRNSTATDGACCRRQLQISALTELEQGDEVSVFARNAGPSPFTLSPANCQLEVARVSR